MGKENIDKGIMKEYINSVNNLSPRATGLSNQEFGRAMKDWDMSARKYGGLGLDYDYSKLTDTNKYGHSNDAGKLPNHVTFSTQSDYAKDFPSAGLWSEENNKPTFTMNPKQVNPRRIDALRWMLKNDKQAEHTGTQYKYPNGALVK